MAFKGNVDSFSLADVFQNLAMNSQTGTLRITPERNPNAEEKYVYFQDGRIRFLSGRSLLFCMAFTSRTTPALRTLPPTR